MRNIAISILLVLLFLSGVFAGCATKKRGAAQSHLPTHSVARDRDSTSSEDRQVDEKSDKKIDSDSALELKSGADSVVVVKDSVALGGEARIEDGREEKLEEKVGEKSSDKEEIPFEEETVIDKKREQTEQRDTSKIAVGEQLKTTIATPKSKVGADSTSVVKDSTTVVSAKDSKEARRAREEKDRAHHQEQRASAQKRSKKDEGRKVVDFTADIMRPVKVGDSSALNLLGNVVFYHNGAIITCDSAVRYSERYMECFDRVVINQKTTFVYGDRADYNGELNLATVYAPIVKMVDEDAVMYTYNFSFNTLDEIGLYSGGATLTQKDNQMESQRGYYYVNSREMVGVDDVEMRSPEYKMISDSVRYNLNTEEAFFFTKSYIWNEKKEILSAEWGNYYLPTQDYEFSRDAYIMTEDQEIWADSIEYNTTLENAILRSNIQIKDDDQNVLGFGDYGEYWGENNKGLLTRNPSLLSYDPNEEKPDTLYMRADSMFFYTFSRDTVFQTTLADIDPRAGSVMNDDELMDAPGGFGSDDNKGSARRGRVKDEMNIDEENAITQSADSSPDGEAQQDAEGEKTADKAIEEMTDKIAKLKEAAAAEMEKEEVEEVADEKETVEKESIEKEGDSGAKGKKEKKDKRDKKDKRGRRAKEETRAESDIGVENGSAQVGSGAEVEDGEMRGSGGDVVIGSEGEMEEGLANSKEQSEENILQETIVRDSMSNDSVMQRSGVDSLDTRRELALDSLGNPILGADSLALTMEPVSEGDTIQRVMYGYRNVRIFRQDFQAVCDSLVSFSIDSTMHLYIDPILWQEDNQITSDIMDIYTKDGQIDRGVFRGEPFMALKADDEGRFSQVKGKIMEAYFRDNEIYKHDVKGNGQTYYYMKDDKTDDLMGFLVMECADITFLIDNRKMEEIIFRVEPVYSIYPMDKIPATQSQELPGFKWESERRPIKKEDVFTRVIRPSQRAEYEAMSQPNFPLTESIIKDKQRMINTGIWRERNDQVSIETQEYVRSVEIELQELQRKQQSQ